MGSKSSTEEVIPNSMALRENHTLRFPCCVQHYNALMACPWPWKAKGKGGGIGDLVVVALIQ